MQFQSQQGQRMVFDNATIALVNAGLSPSEVKAASLTQSYLRLEVLLVNGQTAYKLPFLINDTSNGPVRTTEQRCKLQDAHYIYGVNFYIAKASSTTDSSFVPQTYPNPVTFPTGAASLGALYNGKMSVTVNNVVIEPAIDLLNFNTVPQTQLTAATNSPITEFDGSDFLILQPNIVVIGQKDNQLGISIPAGTTTTYDANTYLIAKFWTILAQNVTVVS